MNSKSPLFFCLTLLTFLFLSCEDEPQRPALSLEFATDAQQIVAGDTVNFSDASTGGPTRWTWYFEGGVPEKSILHSPAVKYVNPGTYPVKLVVGRGADSVSVVKEDYITVGYPQIESGFTADRTTAMQGESITFTDASKGFSGSWEWTFTSGAVSIVSNEQNPVVTFTEYGLYTVTLVVSNPVSSDEETKVDYINILDASSVLADFTAARKNTYEGGTIAFSDASVGTATSWSWVFDGGTPSISTEENPVVTYSAPGRYKVTLIASNAFKSSTKEVADYVLVVPGDQLAAFFPFDGSGADAGPNGLAYEVQGTVLFDGTDRKAISAETGIFSGAGVIVVPDNDALNFSTNDYSVACWVKTDRTSRMMLWQESGEKGSGDNQTWLRLGANTTTQLVGFATEDAAGGSFLGLSAAEKGALYDNLWHHVVAVRQGLVTKVYIDGVKAKEVTSTKGLKDVSNEAPFKIGAQNGTGGFINYFNGSMDDMIIYRKALTDAEVSTLFGL